MPAELHHIQTTRTARYYSLGSFEGEIRELWFVLHGYGQRAEDFLKNFAPLATEGILIIAPEALSRFYTRGFAGDVGASWMTREDRASEIQDYVRYLENLYTEVTLRLKKMPERIVAFGFSQGCPAVLRWQAAGTSPVTEIVIWAGDVPRDLAFSKFRTSTEKARKWLIHSRTDEFISPEIYRESEDLFLSNGIQFHTMDFEGGHKIPEIALKELRSKF
ncbi:MAG: phospholipase [Bacteroidota bacterium]|nr:phospholipase [Bacteroidota bacterium]MDP4229040.1 phospholipase [Bacteroidota bacterium]MDP4235431.1 phospholipase [Bacteroidota bacterium]